MTPLLWLAVALWLGVVIGLFIGRLSVRAADAAATPETTSFPVQTAPVTPTDLTPGKDTGKQEEAQETPTTPPEPVFLGTYRITAYCSCEICCGEWAKNRPGGIVYGAVGVELVPGVSCASTLPFGTVVEIDGLGTYTVQDTMAQWVVDKYGENQIDIYFSDHEAARSFGLKYLDVYLKEGEINDQM